MAITINQIAQRVKVHPGIAGSEVTRMGDDNFRFAVAQQILSALQELTDYCLAQPGMRHYLLTDPETVTVTLDADGKADLQALVIQHGLLIENLSLGEIKHLDYEDPLSPLTDSGVTSMPSNYDLMHGSYWLKGLVLNARGADGPLPGEVGISAPASLTLNNLNVNLTDLLVDRIVNRLRGAPVPPPEQPKK